MEVGGEGAQGPGRWEARGHKDQGLVGGEGAQGLGG